jgi:DNA repair protein RecN (Recombination protein N)
MLSRLSIRDIVLIERLDIDCAAGLSVLTGETGAGKSILLDAFALALGGRGDASLVRQGAEQGQVTAAFDIEPDHPAVALVAGTGIDTQDGLILRRVQLADGRTRAFVNDEPVSVQVLKSLGSALVEIHGQHDDRALVDVASHRQLPRSRASGPSGAPPRRRSRAIAHVSNRRGARPTGYATRSRNSHGSSPRPARNRRLPKSAPR